MPALPRHSVDVSVSQALKIVPQLVLEFDEGSLVVDRDRIRIGSSPLCEIHLLEGPLLHSVIHTEAGASWIEIDDEAAELNVNWRRCRRMALRDGDVISVAGMDITVRTATSFAETCDVSELAQDLAELTAEDLCDRILVEQTAINDFEAGRIQGVQKLMDAMKEAIAAEPMMAELLNSTVAVEFSDECQKLLDQIHEMSEMMHGRTRELDLCESELAAATSLLEESQDRVSRQIETLLDQIGEVPEQTELRASA